MRRVGLCFRNVDIISIGEKKHSTWTHGEKIHKLVRFSQYGHISKLIF